MDTGKKIDYVLNESVSKNGANVVKFTSNSYHAHAVDKQKSKKTIEEAHSSKKSADDAKKRNDDDDVIIVGSEASKNRSSRMGGSPRSGSGSRQVMSNQMSRNSVIGPSGDRLQRSQPDMFRSPQGPRMTSPQSSLRGQGTRQNAYPPGFPPQGQASSLSALSPGRARYRTDASALSQRYVTPQISPGQQAPRNFLNVGNYGQPRSMNIAQGSRMSGPQRMSMPYNTNAASRFSQGQVVRPTGSVDTDITFMREEYVTSQQNARPPNSTGAVVI